MHPRPTTLRFHTPREVARAWTRHEFRMIPRDARRTHIAIGKSFAQFEYVLDRLEALHAIAYIPESAAMHIAVASTVSPELLRRFG
jgi:hypothetical protein